MRSQSLVLVPSLLALATTCVHAVPSPWNDGPKHNDSKPDCKPHEKPHVSTQVLMDQIYESDLKNGAYVLQGIASRFNK